MATLVRPTVAALPLTVPDLVCVLDVDAFAAETTSDLQTLVQDVFHILLEDEGSNPDDPTRGVGVDNYLNGTLAKANRLPAKIEQQLLEDDRIDACSASLSAQPDGSYGLHIVITVDGTVVPLDYTYTTATGLQPGLPEAA